MCQLLGMNCNVPTDIVFSFTGFATRGGRTDEHKDGWGIAFFEYCFMVPANRIGHGTYSAPELKILQEVITLVVFAGFSTWYLGESLRWNHWVAFLMILVAVGVMFGFDKPPQKTNSDSTSLAQAKEE